MLDLHCHILPGLDDGAADLEESLEMAAMAVADGITAVVATPHGGTGVYSGTPSKAGLALERLRHSLERAEIPLQVYAGTEARLLPGLREMLAAGTIRTINGGRYLLLELPEIIPFDRCRQEVLRLQGDGFRVIIAHPERHAHFQNHPEDLGSLVESGVLCQLTAASLLGGFGSAVRRCSEQMLKGGLVHVLASDAHGTSRRLPSLAAAVARAAKLLGDRQQAEQLVGARPERIVADRDLEIADSETPREGLRQKISGFVGRILSPVVSCR